MRDVIYAYMDSYSTLAIDTPFDKAGLHRLLTMVAQVGYRRCLPAQFIGRSIRFPGCGEKTPVY
ncbi:MAG: hypothetical protein ACSLEN_03880 [Candidatus Malihini olakiniferum]